MNFGFKKQLVLLVLFLGGALAVVFDFPAMMPAGDNGPLPFINPTQMLFNNDNPLGAQMAEQNKLPGTIFGQWGNLNWVGGEGVGETPRISTLTATVLRPILFIKYFPFLSLLFVAFCAWLYFRQLKFNPMVCIFAGFATGLNMHFFSVAAWGLSQWNIAIGCTFLALAAVTTKTISQWWARAMLAGFAIGIVIMEGFDSGVILAIAFEFALLATIWFAEGSWLEKLDKTISISLLVVTCATLIAEYTIVTLVGTQIKGIVGADQKENLNIGLLLHLFYAATVIYLILRWIIIDVISPRLTARRRNAIAVPVLGVLVAAVLIAGVGYLVATHNRTSKEPESVQAQKAQAKAERWSFCTQWSLPKVETLRLFVPGLMGYHMYENVDGPDKSSAYWGGIGEDLRLTEIRQLRHSPDPSIRQQADEQMKNFTAGYRRHIGSGDYAGLLVMILAIFAAANSWRTQSPYSVREKRLVWFWFTAALVSLILAFGRHAFLYQFVFELPYFSTTRNPIKFLHVFYVCITVLSAYGAEALYRLYVQNTAPRTQVLPQHLMNWWARVTGFDKKWTMLWIVIVVGSFFSLFVLVAKRADLEHFLTLNGVVPGTESQLAGFCIGEVVFYVVFLVLSVFALTCVVSGAWRGKQAKWAWIVLGVVLFADLFHADRNWLKYYNEKERYALNPVLDFLRQEPYERKSTAKLMPFGSYDITGEPNFGALCNEWLQNQFPYYNIQALDIVQAPRTPELDNNMMAAFRPRTAADLWLCARLWQLTCTRYILCYGEFLTRPMYSGGPAIQGLDPSGDAFEVKARMNYTARPGILVPTTSQDLTAEISDKGHFALVEYKNALPRAKLYSSWQIADSAEAALKTLTAQNFNAQRTVIVSKDTPVQTSGTGSDPGTVKIVDYHPKRIKLDANANTGAVLLFNEKWGPNWQVWVDNKQAPLLQCNYIMRGVYVEKGQHTVEFKYRPPLGPLYVTLAGWGVVILLAGFVVATNRGRKEEVAATSSDPKPAQKSSTTT
jgi:hypothetical protein